MGSAGHLMPECEGAPMETHAWDRWCHLMGKGAGPGSLRLWKRSPGREGAGRRVGDSEQEGGGSDRGQSDGEEHPGRAGRR